MRTNAEKEEVSIFFGSIESVSHNGYSSKQQSNDLLHQNLVHSRDCFFFTFLVFSQSKRHKKEPVSTNNNNNNNDYRTYDAKSIAVQSGIIVGTTSVVSICFYIFQLVAALKYNLRMLYTVVVFELITFGFRIHYEIAQAQMKSFLYLGEMSTLIIINFLICFFIINTTLRLDSLWKSRKES